MTRHASSFVAALVALPLLASGAAAQSTGAPTTAQTVPPSTAPAGAPTAATEPTIHPVAPSGTKQAADARAAASDVKQDADDAGQRFELGARRLGHSLKTGAGDAWAAAKAAFAAGAQTIHERQAARDRAEQKPEAPIVHARQSSNGTP